MTLPFKSRELLVSLLAVIVILLSSYALAGYDGPMRFIAFQPCNGNSDECAKRMLAEGRINDKAAVNLKAAIKKIRDEEAKWMRSLETSESDIQRFVYDTLPPTVCFDSPGGSLSGGMELGKAIRQLGADTCLNLSYSEETVNTPVHAIRTNVVCASACALAFLGGKNRYIDDGAKLGVHQFSGKDGNIGDSAAQLTMAVIANYLDEMGISRRLLDIAALTPASNIRFLSTHDLISMKVDNTHAAPTSWQLAALPDGRVMAVTSMRRPGRDAILQLGLVKNGSAVHLIISVGFPFSYFRSTKEIAESLNRGKLEVYIDGKLIAKKPKLLWQHTTGQGNNTYLETIPLPTNAISLLSIGSELIVETGQPNATEDLDTHESFSLNGLGQFLPAVNR